MKTYIFTDALSLAQKSAERLRDQLNRQPDTLFCFAAGRTQIPTYQLLAEWARDGLVDVSKARVIGLDDIVGADVSKGEGFRFFLDKHLFKPAEFNEANIEFFNTKAPDMRAECARIDAWLDKNGPIEFLLLGIGLNGHIGYNEPGTPIDARSFIIEQLAKESMSVSREYFDHAFNVSQGVTLGLSDLLKAKTILVQATGEEKRPVVEALGKGEVDPSIPVSHLQSRADVELYLDAAAAGKTA